MSFSRVFKFVLLVALLFVVIPTTTSADDGKEPQPVPHDVVEQSPTATGGPDTYGYTFIDRNSPGGPNSNSNESHYVNISTTGTAIIPLPDGDDGTATFPIPFTFRFFGTSYTSVRLCANGYLTFAAGTSCDWVPHNNSVGIEPTDYIAGWWNDLDGRCAGSEFDYQTLGTTPTRRFVVQWTGVGHYNSQCATANRGTFQIVLHETSNIIEVLHNETAGLNTPASTHYVEIGRTSTTPLTAYASTTAPGMNWGVMFLPPPQNTSTAQWVCNSPKTAIPDGPSGASITDSIVIPGPSASDVADLNVFLQIPHTWVSDLDVTLTHVESGKSVIVTNNFCGGNFDNFGSLVVDDEAPATMTCSALPAIGLTGSVRPSQALSAFDGDRWHGTWRVTVRDDTGADLGTLMQWCLGPTLVPTAVTLVSFEGRPVEDYVELTWETASETELLGFNLYQSMDGVRPDTPLNAELIASQSPGGGQGALYAYDDHMVSANRTYTYWLEDVGLDGTRTVHDPITVSTIPPTAVTISVWQVAPPISGATILGLLVAGMVIMVVGWRVRQSSKTR